MRISSRSWLTTAATGCSKGPVSTERCELAVDVKLSDRPIEFGDHQFGSRLEKESARKINDVGAQRGMESGYCVRSADQVTAALLKDEVGVVLDKSPMCELCGDGLGNRAALH